MSRDTALPPDFAAPPSSTPAAQSVPPETDDRPTTGRRRGGWFRAFWRWHFYASFLVIPVLLVLAATGLIYLFRFEMEPALHPDLMTVQAPPQAGPDAIVSYDEQLEAVGAAYPDLTVGSMAEPRADDRPTVFTAETADGEPRSVFVDPWSGEVLGSLDPDGTVSGTAVRIHGELLAGRWGDYVLELGACWAIVMAVTGYVLVIQGRAARKRRLTARKVGATLRSSHAIVGATLGIGLLGLLVTGLPWTSLWGETVQKLATDNGTSLWSSDPSAVSNPLSTLDESLPHSHEIPWALGDTTVPVSASASAPDSDSGQGRTIATLDTAVFVAVDEGLRRPLTIAMPAGEDGVFSAIGYAFTDPGAERTVHVDRFGADVVAQYGYQDYPVLAQVVSQGIALHEGRRFGLVSFWGAAAFCLGIIFMCVSGPLMWWRRRPRGGGLGAPRGRMPLRASPLLLVAVIALALLLPLFGLSLAVVLLLDQLLLRRVPVLGRWFATT